MPTHNQDENVHGWQGPKDVDPSQGYEQSDVRVTGIVVFLAALAIFVVATAGLCYVIGKVFNAELNKEDGPNNKWTQTVNIRQLGDLPSNPEMQRKVAELAQEFPTPRLQLDDGNQDITDLHGREDLLLDHYSWADQSQGSPRRVRIPIERAMELIAQTGLPVAPEVKEAPLMAGDSKPMVTAPLTNGFARTGYEQDAATAEVLAGKRGQEN